MYRSKCPAQRPRWSHALSQTRRARRALWCRAVCGAGSEPAKAAVVLGQSSFRSYGGRDPPPVGPRRRAQAGSLDGWHASITAAMDSSRGLAATTRTMAVPAPLQDDGRRRQRRTPTRSTRRGELDDGPLREIRIEGHVLRDKLYM